MPRMIPAELARHIGVNRSTVSRHLRQRPHLIDATGSVDVDEYLAAIADPPPVGPAEPSEPLALMRARARVLTAEAELALAAARLAAMEGDAAAFRAAVLAIPYRTVTNKVEAEACRAALASALARFTGGAPDA